MRRADVVLVLVLACVALASTPMTLALSRHGSGAPSYAEIQGPAGVTRLALDRDAEYVVEGGHGRLTVVVREGSVRVTRSSCPDKVCVHSGAVRASGSAIACVPNGVVIRIEGERSDGIDAVAR